MAGLRNGYKCTVRKPVGRRVRVWRCCGRPLGDSRSHREARSHSGAGKGLGHRVRRRHVTPNASAVPCTVTKSMLLLSNIHQSSPNL